MRTAKSWLLAACLCVCVVDVSAKPPESHEADQTPQQGAQSPLPPLFLLLANFIHVGEIIVPALSKLDQVLEQGTVDTAQLGSPMPSYPLNNLTEVDHRLSLSSEQFNHILQQGFGEQVMMTLALQEKVAGKMYIDNLELLGASIDEAALKDDLTVFVKASFSVGDYCHPRCRALTSISIRPIVYKEGDQFWLDLHARIYPMAMSNGDEQDLHTASELSRVITRLLNTEMEKGPIYRQQITELLTDDGQLVSGFEQLSLRPERGRMVLKIQM